MSSGIGTQRGTSIDALRDAAVTRVKGDVSKEGVDEIMTRELSMKEENLRGNQPGFNHNRGVAEASNSRIFV